MLVLEALHRRDDVELHIIVGGAALLPKYVSRSANILLALKEKRYENVYEMYFNLEGNVPVTKAKTAGLGVIEFASLFERIDPDIVIARADRFEVLSAAMAAAMMNIPIAHIEGGDVSGTIDESVRHAITKLAHMHFTTNEAAKGRVLRMGEDPRYVFNFGSPDIEVVTHFKDVPINHEVHKTGSGTVFDVKNEYVIVMYHPVTSEVGKLGGYTKELLSAVHRSGLQAIWFWPNFDAGADEIARELRVFNDRVDDHRIHFMRYLAPQDFIGLLAKAKCVIGNSSAGLKECSYLGVPVVNVGSRQHKRLQAENVRHSGNGQEELLRAIQEQVRVGAYTSSHLYAGEKTSERIAHQVATAELYTQKNFVD